MIQAFDQELQQRGLNQHVRLCATGCHGFCERGPLAVIHPRGLFYQNIQVADVPEIVEKTIIGGDVVQRLLYRDPNTKARIPQETDVPFYKHQQRVVFDANGVIDPTSLDDYVARGGYQALASVLERMSPEEVIEEIRRSGLRGRGEAAFRPAASGLLRGHSR